MTYVARLRRRYFRYVGANANSTENAVATALSDPANHTGDLGGKATTKSLTDAIVRHLDD